MKHLHNFDTVAEYEAVKDTLEMPYIVSIDETDGLQYNTEVIRVPQGSGSSGGADLEGEYYLAKPNGRYWKSKLANMCRGKYPIISNYNGEVFTDEQLDIIYGYCTLFTTFGFTATYDYGGIPSSGAEVLLPTPSEVSRRAGTDEAYITQYKYGETTLLSCMGAWQECDIHTVIEGMSFEGGLVEFIRLYFESDLGPMTDDEMLTFISDMFMLEQVTKEEYESYYKW